MYFNDSVWTEIVKSAGFFFLNYVAKELVEPYVILSKENVTLPLYKSRRSADLCKRTNTKTKKFNHKKSSIKMEGSTRKTIIFL